MGLRASDFNLADLKGTKIVAMNINTRNENTVTVAHKDGHETRHRMPKVLLDLMEFYRNEVK